MAKHRIAFKPFILHVPTEREAVYNKLKGHMKKLERIINDPSTDDEIKLKFIALHVKVANVAKGVLTDYERDKIRFDLDALDKKVEDAVRERKAEQGSARREALGY